MDGPDKLKPVESGLFSLGSELVQQRLADSGASSCCRQIHTGVFGDGLGPRKESVGLGYDDRHQAGLQRVAMHKDLGNFAVLGKDVFDLLRGNVLA